jgi:hypothetical protein
MSGILQPRSTRLAISVEPEDASGGGATVPRFIFMLTRNDSTIREARALVDVAVAAGVRHVGAKDVGLAPRELASLYADLRDAGCTTYLEVVSERPAEALRSAETAVRLRPDYLIGGVQIDAIATIIAGSGVRFFPYVGHVVGHPCLLRGTIDEIVGDARTAPAAGVDGINLLAYRFDGDVEDLITRVQEAVRIPVLCAGSVDSAARIRALRQRGVWGFTVGTAVLDGVIVPGRPLADQLRAVIRLAAEGA